MNSSMSACYRQLLSTRTHISIGSLAGRRRGRHVPTWMYTSPELVESHQQVSEASTDEGQGYVTQNIVYAEAYVQLVSVSNNMNMNININMNMKGWIILKSTQNFSKRFFLREYP